MHLMNRCQVCANEAGNRLHVAREMMLGFRDQFTYLECGYCGCVQLADVPADMAKYYPESYYSFSGDEGFKAYVKAYRAAYAFGRRSTLGWLSTHILGPYDAVRAVRRANLSTDSKILDVGCGAGNLAFDMRKLGFEHVIGIDPYIPADISYECGDKIFKRTLVDTKGDFDVVMFHHSYEHMSEPFRQMREASRLLRPGGLILLRIPSASSYAWRHYGVHWMHLDAPRHLFLHTLQSIKLITSQCGLATETVFYEGNETQFIGSEQYIKDIPLSDPRSVYSGGYRRWTNWAKSRALRRKADELNRKCEGDLLCFHLRKG